MNGRIKKVFLDTIFLSIIVGKIRGGSLMNIGELNFQRAYLFFLGFLIQLAIGVLGFKEVPFSQIICSSLHIISYIFIFVGLYANLKIPGVRLLGLGSFLNFLVIAANGGRMPVSLDRLEYLGRISDIELLKSGSVPMYIATKGDVLSKILGDVLALPKPIFGSQVFSIGDIIMGIGFFILLQEVMLGDKLIKDHGKGVCDNASINKPLVQ